MRKQVLHGILAFMLAAVCLVALVGCGLTPEQWAELGLLQDRSEQTAKELAEAKDDFVAAYKSYKAGDFSREDLDKLADRFRSVKAENDAVVERIEALKAKQVPLWLSIIFGITGLASGGAFGVKAIAVGRTLKGVLGMFGAVSRAGDRVEAFGELVRDEIPNAKGVTEDMLRELHHKATAKEI